jgi:hypothetical protein
VIKHWQTWRWVGLAALFIICVLLKLNGSSVGKWSEVVDQPGRPPGLLLFEPQDIRADEWQVWTPSALSQARQNPPFPLVNLSIGGGRSPMIVNLPIAYYTTLLRPQLWGFFLLDFERGFSWCWCCKVFGMFIGFAWLLRRVCAHPPIVVLGVLWIVFSNYVQWWFSSPVMLPEMLASWAICTGCLLEFFKQSQRWRLTLAFVLFVICGTNFILCLYPPYQIPLLWLMVAIGLGSWLECRQTHDLWFGKRGLLVAAAAILLVCIVLLPFWIDARTTLDMVAHTQYPGGRRSSGGALSLFKLWSGCVAFFQTVKTLPTVYNNICEGSNFYPLWPFAVFVAVLARLRRNSSVSPLVIALGIFAICLSIYCVVPLPKVFLRVTLLDIVTERRALLGLGIANILLCCVFLDRFQSSVLRTSSKLISGVTWFAVLTFVVWLTYHHDPAIFPDLRQVILAIIGTGAAVTLFAFERKRPWALMLIVALLIITNLRVNPVMKGLDPLLHSEAFEKMENLRASDPSAKWIVYRQFLISELVLASGAPVLSGNKVLPDFDFLHRLDPSVGGGHIYNRYGYVYCDLPRDLGQPSAHLMNDALYILYLPPDLPLLQEVGVRYLVFPDSSHESELYGFTQVYGNERAGIFIYKRL